MPPGQERHRVRHSLCPAAHPLALTVPGFTTHRVTALPGRSPVSPGMMSNTSYPWPCLGPTVLLNSSSPSPWADQPWQLCVPGDGEQLRLAPTATDATTGSCHCHCHCGQTCSCHLTDSSALWLLPHPVSRPHITSFSVTF